MYLMAPAAAGTYIAIAFFFLILPLAVVMMTAGGRAGGTGAGSGKVKFPAQKFFHLPVGLSFCAAKNLNSGILKSRYSSGSDTAADQNANTSVLQEICQGGMAAAVSIYDLSRDDFVLCRIV